jgi:hypothetical protein
MPHTSTEIITGVLDFDGRLNFSRKYDCNRKKAVEQGVEGLQAAKLHAPEQ